ncbi:MAG: fibrobacter succinogenes major paralogous domain-containing protein [Rikenellaceae bacterium]|nr:fibrobacter succinogenes major paralogous domain-containing protein [Rikenellaceae bacterium]
MTKTLFDPCPAGWRVPRSGEDKRSPWASFTQDNGSWITDGFTPDQGRRYDVSVIYGASGGCFIPAQGVRDPWSGEGILNAGGASCCLWSSTILSPDAVHYYLFCADYQYSIHEPWRHDFPAYGFSVRCVRE